MPHYDCVIKGKDSEKSRTSTYRYEPCYSDVYQSSDEIERMSILVFPKGIWTDSGVLGKTPCYGWDDGNDGMILSKYDTNNITGIERWAGFLGAFIPGTSFMLDYDEVKGEDICRQDNVPLSEFRIEDLPHRPVSSMMKKIWMNGVRYCWEDDGPKMAGFCLTYWTPEMKPYQAFQLFLLAHEIICEREHACYAQNPKKFDNAMYQSILNCNNDEINDKKTTKFLSKGQCKREPNSYEIIDSPTAKIVKLASYNIENYKELIPLKQILEVWK